MKILIILAFCIANNIRSVAPYDDTTLDYTESVYVETDPPYVTDPYMSHWSDAITDTTPSQPPTDAEPDFEDKDEHVEDFDDVLTPDAVSNIYNKSLMSAKTPGAAHQAYVLRWEWWLDLRHFGDENSFVRACYHIATTYRNAMLDLRRYYPLRYLYYDNVEYEVGYLTHEIVFKYQIILELFHLVQRKFLYHQNRDFARPTYMLYIYTNVLYQSTDIIHLCNMMHEVEKKYEKYHSKGPFGEEVKPIGAKGNATISAREAAILEYKRKRLKLMKKHERERKQRMKMIEKGKNVVLTKFTTTKRKKHWDLFYGWSIEDW